MTKPPNYGHLDHVPVIGNTKEWFKKDLETIKKSIKTTVKNIPWIFLLSFIISAVAIYLLTFRIDLLLTLIYTIIFMPIAILGFFLFHLMATKGYDIRIPGGGGTGA